LNINISNNIIRLNGTTTSSPGVVIQPGVWGGDSNLILMGNVCSDNNINSIQMLIGSDAVSNPKIVAYGNVCAFGLLIGLIVARPLSQLFVSTRGLETGYASTASPIVRNFVPGDVIVHNDAIFFA
jgi:hypothetical protein